MGIDRKTQLSTYAVIFDKKAILLKTFEERNKEICDNHKENPSYWISEDDANLSTEEYYFDETETSIHYSGSVETPCGKVYMSFDIPLSDTVLIDILQHSMKKLGKLKTAMETLK